MQTSALGTFELSPLGSGNLPSTVKRSGFTLLELLVVIVVLSIATALIVIRGTPGDSNYLSAEGQKLSQILRIAQQEAKLKSIEIRFTAGENGFRFESFDGIRWAPLASEPLLRERPWDHPPIKVALLRDGQPQGYLSFQDKEGLAKQSVVLQKNTTRLMVDSRPGGRFVVGKPFEAVNQNTP